MDLRGWNFFSYSLPPSAAVMNKMPQGIWSINAKLGQTARKRTAEKFLSLLACSGVDKKVFIPEFCTAFAAVISFPPTHSYLDTGETNYYLV